MATGRRFVDHVIEQSGLSARLSARSMFGEYALYLDETLVGYCADNSLYAKYVPQTAAVLEGLPRQPLYPGSKPHALLDELLDEPQRLRELLLALHARLPPPVPRAASRGQRGARGPRR